MKRTICGIVLVTAAIFAATGCSDKATGSDNGGGGGTGTDISGTWALTEAVTGTVSVAVPADSSSLYLVVDGSAVIMHEYVADAPTASAVVRTGSYTGGQFVFTMVTYTVAAGSGTLELRNPADSADTYVFTPYAGTVPPAFWPAGSVEDDTYEPDDDDISGATALAAGIVQVHTTANGDQDWFVLSLAPGYVHTVVVAGITASYDLRVFDADTNRVTDDDDVNIDEDAGTVTFIPNSQATFYVRLRGDDESAYTVVLTSTVIPTPPYTGAWYLAADTLTSGVLTFVVSETTSYTEATTVEIAEFSGYRLIRYHYSVEGTVRDTMVFVYVDDRTAVVNGDTIGIWRAGDGLRVYMDMGGDNYAWLQSSSYLPYYGTVPPAHWDTVPVVAARKPSGAR